MYLGPVMIQQRQYVNRWDQRFGDYAECVGVVPVEHHAYVCGACGRRHEVLTQPAEPFYCHCGALVKTDPPGGRPDA